MTSESIRTMMHGPIVPYADVVSQYKDLRSKLEAHNVASQNRLYLGADHDCLAPRLLGGKWTLVDDYENPIRCPLDLTDLLRDDVLIPEGTRIASIGKKHKDPNTRVYVPKRDHTLVFYRRRDEQYCKEIAADVLKHAPYVLTDSEQLPGYARIADSIRLGQRSQRLITCITFTGSAPIKLPVSRQLFLHQKR